MKSGYQYGLRQAVEKLTLNLKVPSKFSSLVVDAWILSALEINVETYSPIVLNKGIYQEGPLAYFRRLLLTTTILLQDVKIPVFEHVAIDSIRQSTTGSNHLIVDFWFPALADLPTKALETWFGVAHRLLTRVCEETGDHHALKDDVETLHQQYCKPWLSTVLGGKSLIPVLQSAFELGIPFVSCGAGRYILGWGHRSRIFDRSSNSLDSVIGAQISHRKDLAIQLMKQAGIPVPLVS